MIAVGRISLDMLLSPEPTAAEILRHSIAAVVYAEMRAIFLGWAGVCGWDPVANVWATVRRALDECLVPGTPPFLQRVQALLREESMLALEPALHRAGPAGLESPIGRGQLGSLQGLDETFHECGIAAMFHRAGDQRVVSIAMAVSAFLKSSIALRS